MTMSNLLAVGFGDQLWSGSPFYVWQIPVVILLVVLIIVWIQYRKKQM